jgi:hypothetical protein
MLEPKEQAKALKALAGPDIQIWLNNNGGYVALNWVNQGAIGRWDYVALYDNDPKDPYGYLTLQWQYTSNQNSPYVTGTTARGVAGPPYWIAYVGWDYQRKEYVIVAKAGPYQV